jgi:Protein of unknown function (DUF3100)
MMAPDWRPPMTLAQHAQHIRALRLRGLGQQGSGLLVYEPTPTADAATGSDEDTATHPDRRHWLISIGVSTALSLGAVLIGTHKIDVGKAAVVLMPIVWAVVLGAMVGLQRIAPITGRVRAVGELLIRVGIVFFLARLGTEIGPSLGKVTELGPAIVMQEIGHIFGTVILALPVAVGLGLGRAAIGASWSIDRESFLAYAIERFGTRSPEYRGVFGVWLVGSVFGAVYISFLAGLLGSLGWLHPLALALGLGLGSSSMMLGGIAALSVIYPDQAAEITALAALSNLVTNIVGFYAGVFVSLPVCRRLYAFWTRVFRRPQAEIDEARLVARGEIPSTDAQAVSLEEAQSSMGVVTDPPAPSSRRAVLAAYVITGAAGLFLSWVGTREFRPVQLVGIAVLLALTGLSFVLAGRFRQVPASVWVLALATLASATFVPFSDALLSSVDGLDVMLIGLPQIALIGMALGRDVAAFKHLSWRVVVIALITLSSSFILAAVLAQTVIHL